LEPSALGVGADVPLQSSAMSENWVGPGWWMASDGKWYPPRVTADAKEAASGAGSTRWSRRTPDGEPIPGSRPMSLSEEQAELLATRAERAASVANRPAPVSREAKESLEIVELDEPIDLRSGAQATSDLRPASIENVPSFVAIEGAGVSFEGAAEAHAVSPPAAFTGPPSGRLGFLESALPAPSFDRADLPNLPEIPTMAEVPDSQMLTSLDDRVDDRGIDTTDTGSEVDIYAGHTPIDEVKDDTSGLQRGEPRVAPRLSIAMNGAPSAAPNRAAPAPLVHAVLPALVERAPERSRSGPILLALATALAIASGVLGALWMRDRSDVAELRAELVQAEAPSNEVTPDVDIEELNDQIRTVTLENERLQQQLNDMSALVLELPAGRVIEIEVPFTPIFADEENGRLIAMSADGEYIVWGEGVDGPITDSGSIVGTPTGLFAATRKAWVTTDTGRIDVLSLVADEPGLPSVEFGPTEFLAAGERGYWTFNGATGEVVRLRKSDGGITASVGIPVPVIDLTIGAGSVWALGDDGRVYRINTADFTVQPFDVGADLISVTAGPDALWTLSAADGSLRRVDPVSGEVLVTVPVGRDPIDATFAGSSVWVALRSGASLIEVDTRTSAVVSRTTLQSEPTALHQGDSGVFVTTEGEVRLLQVASLTAPNTLGDDADSAEDATDDADS
jgi:hypothetical protein